MDSLFDETDALGINQPTERHGAATTARKHQASSPDRDAERSAKRSREENVRTRVSRACDRCKARKTRCSGKFPCKSCSQMNTDCRFTAAYRRGRLPSIEPAEEDALLELTLPSAGKATASRDHAHGTSRMRAATLDNAVTIEVSPVEDALPSLSDISPEPRDRSRTRLGTELLSLDLSHSSLRSSPEPIQTGTDGLSFMQRLQRKLHQHVPPGSSNSSIFTFGDLPLPDTDPSFVILPPRNEADNMVRRYFDFATATHRFLHRPTVEEWVAELYETNGAMREADTARSRTALLFMVFAHSAGFSSKMVGGFSSSCARAHHAADSSARFFSAAEHQLSGERGRIRLTSVQARLAQCFYLLAHSRLNHCWTLFGTTARLIFALGIHRRTRVEGGVVDYVDLECRKRTFWCAYNLDIYLSCALGRPRTFHDEDCDQDLPGRVDDNQLLRRGSAASPPVPRHHSIMSAPVAHYRLSRILAGILRDLYGIRPPSRSSERLRLAEKYTKKLADWRGQVSYLLDTDGDSSMFVRIALRQRDLLKMAFWHAQILVHRPFLLESFSSLNDNVGGGREKGAKENVRQCLGAAMGIARLIHEIDTSEQLYSTMFLLPYFGFSAVVVLYVHAIQQQHHPNKPSTERYAAALNAATLCHSHLTSMASAGSLTERYSVVLQELRSELQLPSSSAVSNTSSVAATPALSAGDTIESVISGGASSKASSMNGSTRNMREEELPVQVPHHVAVTTVHVSVPEQTDLMDMMRGSDGLSLGRGRRSTPIDEGIKLGAGGMHPPLIFSPAEESPGGRHGGKAGGRGGERSPVLAGWGQFDSLVTGGAGRLDAFFADSASLGTWDIPPLP